MPLRRCTIHLCRKDGCFASKRAYYRTDRSSRHNLPSKRSTAKLLSFSFFSALLCILNSKHQRAQAPWNACTHSLLSTSFLPSVSFSICSDVQAFEQLGGFILFTFYVL